MLKAQEDVAGGQKREVEEEDPYNEDNVDQVSFQQNQDQFLLMSRFPLVSSQQAASITAVDAGLNPGTLVLVPRVTSLLKQGGLLKTTRQK